MIVKGTNGIQEKASCEKRVLKKWSLFLTSAGIDSVAEVVCCLERKKEGSKSTIVCEENGVVPLSKRVK